MSQFTYKYPRPGLTVDCIIYYLVDKSFFIRKKSDEHYQNFVLLIKRKNEPFKDCWALPGGFVEEHEDTRSAAFRELREEVSYVPSYLDRFLIADKPHRDPRGWTISVVYTYLSKQMDIEPKVIAGDDAGEAKWFNVNELPELAFDHKDIIDAWFFDKGYYARD